MTLKKLLGISLLLLCHINTLYAQGAHINTTGLDFKTRETCSKLVNKDIRKRFYDLKYVRLCGDYLTNTQYFYYIERIEGKDMLPEWQIKSNHSLDFNYPNELLVWEEIKTMRNVWGTDPLTFAESVSRDNSHPFVPVNVRLLYKDYLKFKYSDCTCK